MNEKGKGTPSDPRVKTTEEDMNNCACRRISFSLKV
jgi:hypothetical protein